jgi:hypothetical protein
MQFSPYLSMGQAYPFSRNAQNNYTWTDDLSTKRGKHTLRVDAYYSRRQVNSYWPQYPAGLLSFDPGLTSLPGIVDTGDALASMLLGLPSFAEQTIDAQPSYFRRAEGSLAFRDRYEAAKGLIISLGLSAGLYIPRSEKYNRQSTIDLSAINPANGLPGALAVAGQGGYSSTFQPTLVRVAPS